MTKAKEAAEKILKAFETGTLPEKLATVFLLPEDLPLCRWSWGNRLLVAEQGYLDARGYRQWQEVGRTFKKGQKAFYIISPIVKRRRQSDEGSPNLLCRIQGNTCLRP